MEPDLVPAFTSRLWSIVWSWLSYTLITSACAVLGVEDVAYGSMALLFWDKCNPEDTACERFKVLDILLYFPVLHICTLHSHAAQFPVPIHHSFPGWWKGVDSSQSIKCMYGISVITYGTSVTTENGMNMARQTNMSFTSSIPLRHSRRRVPACFHEGNYSFVSFWIECSVIKYSWKTQSSLYISISLGANAF